MSLLMPVIVDSFSAAMSFSAEDASDVLSVLEVLTICVDTAEDVVLYCAEQPVANISVTQAATNILLFFMI